MFVGLLSAASEVPPNAPQGDLLAASLTVLAVSVLLFLLAQIQIGRLEKRVKKLEAAGSTKPAPPAES